MNAADIVHDCSNGLEAIYYYIKFVLLYMSTLQDVILASCGMSRCLT